MPSLHVCPLSKIDTTVAATGARTLITLLNVGTPVTRPAPILLDRHLFIAMSDIVDPMEGHVVPSEAHLAALLAFFQRWDAAEPLLIHCYAGVSRSTAAAYIAVCALDPGQNEAIVAARLRKASPTATPNKKMIALADDMLGRRGRMVDAIAAIGSGVDCFEGTPFELALR